MSTAQPKREIPISVSPGALLVFPDGTRLQVPRVQLDMEPVSGVTVFARPGTMIFTDHGQELLASGASYAEALRDQY